MIEEFDCQCGWKFILGKKRFYGPIWPDDDVDKLAAARMQPIRHFTYGYADCAAYYERQKSERVR